MKPVVFSLGLSACASFFPSQAEVSPGRVPGEVALQGQLGFNTAMAAYDYRRALDVAQSWRQQEPQSVEAAIAVARASNSLGDLSTRDAETEAHVDRSLAALEPFLPKEGTSQPAAEAGRLHYYYAEAVGVYVHALGSGVIELLPKVTMHAELAAKLAPGEDDGAPLRFLGILLAKAPAWPHGPGDVERGVKILQDVMERYPRRAEGFLHYADVLLDQSRVQDGQRYLGRGKELVGQNPRAKKLAIDIEARVMTNRKVKQYQ